MKITLTLAFAVLAVCLFGVSEARTTLREKRALSWFKCPPDTTTDEECIKYAKNKSKNDDHCLGFFVKNGYIKWQTCGPVKCLANEKLVSYDHSKVYPGCCKKCEPTKKT